MNGLGFRSWPDRLALKPGVARPLWVEFKRLGETPTDAQRENHALLRALGQKIVVCDTYEAAVEAYEGHRG